MIIMYPFINIIHFIHDVNERKQSCFLILIKQSFSDGSSSQKISLSKLRLLFEEDEKAGGITACYSLTLRSEKVSKVVFAQLLS